MSLLRTSCWRCREGIDCSSRWRRSKQSQMRSRLSQRNLSHHTDRCFEMSGTPYTQGTSWDAVGPDASTYYKAAQDVCRSSTRGAPRTALLSAAARRRCLAAMISESLVMSPVD